MIKKLQLKWIDYLALLILFCLPFLHVAYGVDVSDSGYSLGNFMNMQNMEGTWVIATFLATALGKLFTMLPYGTMWIGMNVYCSVILGVIVVMSYVFLRQKINTLWVFLGEFLALSLCWCPHVIIYNYLTYFFITLGSILLLCGLNKCKNILLFLAGVVLASSVFVRFPNVVQTMLIIVVWYDCIIRKRGFKESVKLTLMCIFGYICGAALWYGVISGMYGVHAFSDMIMSLFGMTSQATSYSPMAMVTTILLAYVQEAKTFLRLIVVIMVFAMLCALVKKKWMYVIAVIGSTVSFGVFSFWAYKKNVFSRDYNDYRSMYFWAAGFIMISFAFAIMAILRRKEDVQMKAWAMAIVIIMLVTPLGSNNGIYPVFNNLFLVAPFTFFYLKKVLSEERKAEEEKKKRIWKYPFCVAAAGVFTAVLIQGALFCLVFTFRDNGFIIGTGSTIEGNDALQGMHTNSVNARQLEEITMFIYNNGYRKAPTIFYGNIPALSYILDLPCALSHTWPDLDSYPTELMENELNDLKQPPLVMINVEQYPELQDTEITSETNEKTKMMIAYMTTNGYKEIFRNDHYAIYEVY